MVARDEALARLRAAPWLKGPDTQAIMALLDGAGHRTRAVGGQVRDTLLGLEARRPDIDMATQLLPDEVIRRAKSVGMGAYPTGIDHGTVTLRSGAVTAEVTTLREDVATDGRHAVVAFGTDWRRDAERRDFTMNALYADMDGTLFDPLDGLADCLAGRVRFIGDPDRRIAEDRLRVFRFFRFSASHGGQRFDEAGLAACARAAGTLGALSAERVGAEMRRLLSLAKMADTFAAMRDLDVLDASVCPATTLDRLAKYEDLAGAPRLAGRLALLVEEVGADTLKDLWRLSNAEVDAAQRTLSAAHLLIGGHPGEAAYRYPDVVSESVPVAGVLGRADMAWAARTGAAISALKVPAFPLRGEDLLALGMTPGPAIGRMLGDLERQWIESGFALGHEDLTGLARDLMRGA